MADGDINQAVELFKSRDQRKRRWAVDLASELGTPEAAALLVKALQDQSWSLREYAIERSARLGKPMVAPLCRVLNSGIWFSRAAAVQALKAIGDPEALGPLCLVVGDPNRSVADSARAAVTAMLEGLQPGRLGELEASMTAEQRSALRAMAAKAGQATVAGPAVEGSHSEDEADPDALQKLRAALKAAAKQEMKYEDDES